MAAAELGSFVATCIVTTDMTMTETDALMNGTIHFKSDFKSVKYTFLLNTRYGAEGSVYFICVLKGADPFFAEMREALNRLQFNYEQHYVRLKSYENTESKGDVKIEGDLSEKEKREIEGKHVVIVEDIIDTGNTLKKFTEVGWGMGSMDVL